MDIIIVTCWILLGVAVFIAIFGDDTTAIIAENEYEKKMKEEGYYVIRIF